MAQRRNLRLASAAVSACLALSLAPAVAAPAGRSSLQTDIRALKDESEIRHLLVEYGRRFDTRDLAGYSQLFAKNGEWSGPLGNTVVTSKGPAGVLAMMEKNFGADPKSPAKVSDFHLMTNMLIKVEGERATAHSWWTYFVRDKDNRLVPQMAGQYNDMLIREDGKWKFLRRLVSRDIPPLK